MEPSNKIQTYEDHLNNESQDSEVHEVQDIRMISPPQNQVREQERNNHRSRGGRGNYNRVGQPSHHHQNASANSVPYNGGTHWFTQSTYVGGWDYPAPHFMPPMRPYGFPAGPVIPPINQTARPLPPPPRQQRHDSSVQNHRNPHHRAQNQGWHADPYVGGWDYATPSPMIPPVNQGFLPPMAYYIPPNFGQQNMNDRERPPQSPPLPPTYQAKHFHNKGLYWRIVNQVNYYFGDENLKGDTFLKSHMDADGWVPITLIATFNRMRQLTDDIAFILFALRGSSVVEVSGDKIRRRR